MQRSPNSSFVGRDDALTKMGEALLPREETRGNGDGSRKYVLHGIGGVGKSELALQFAQKHRQRYWGIFWVDFSSQESMWSSYSQIAAKLDFSTTKEDAVGAVNARLSNSRKPWLLVLDNCDDPNEDYQAHYPDNDEGAIIMTTRMDLSVDYGPSGSTPLEGLDYESSLKLLLALSLCKREHGGNEAAAHAIVTRLEHHALAITIAGSIVGKAKLYTLPEYAKVLDQKMKELFGFRPRQKRPLYGTIHATFDVSVKRLEDSEDREAAAHALELLNILAFMDRKDIGEDIFTRAWAYGENIKQRGGINPDPYFEPDDIASLSMWHYETAMPYTWTLSTDLGPFRKARSCLHELSLISCDEDTHTISMHPLLHEWARERLGADAYAEAWIACASTLALSLQEDFGWRDFTPKMIRHLEVNFALRARDWPVRFSKLEACRIFYIFVWQSYRGYSVHTSNVLYEMEEAGIGALDELNPTFNDLKVLYLKGAALSRIGEYTKSLEISNLVLKRRRSLLPAEHIDILHAQSALALQYNEIGQHDQAIPLLEELIGIQGSRGPLHDGGSLSERFELARAYLGTNHVEKAVSLLKTVVEEREITLPPEHPDLLSSQHALALAYSRCDHLELGIPVLEHVVVVRRNTLACTNTNRFTSEYNLINNYITNGQFSEARNLLQMIEEGQDAHLLSLEQRKKLQYLRNHLKYNTSLEHERSGRISEAIYEMEQVVENESSLPDDDSRKLQDMIVLARRYLKNEQSKEARQLFEQVQAHQDRLPEGWREKTVKEVEIALQEYSKSGQVPEWLFVWPWCRPGCPCWRCVDGDSGWETVSDENGDSEDEESEDQESEDEEAVSSAKDNGEADDGMKTRTSAGQASSIQNS